MKTKNILFIISIFLLLISCNGDGGFFDVAIEIDVPTHKSRLAVTSFLSIDQTSNRALVSFSEGVTNKPETNQLLNNASITLSYNDEDISFSLTDNDGIYEADETIDFTTGTRYTMRVSNPDFGTITATQKMPEIVPISEASIDENKIRVEFTDPAGEDNYYLLMLYHYNPNNDNYEIRELEPFGPSADWSYLKYGIVFTDVNFEGNSTEIVANYWGSSGMETEEGEGEGNQSEVEKYKIILFNTTEDYYRYDRTFSLSREMEGNPFVEPIILHKNFENGYGVFALMNKSEKIVTLP